MQLLSTLSAVLLSTLPLQSIASSVKFNNHHPETRQINGGGQGDPGVYPGGTDAAETGWRALPSVTGATLDTTTFVIGNSQAVLTAYVTADFDPSKIKRVVVEFPGENRDAWNQFLYMDLALDRAIQGGEVKREEVVIVAPMPFTLLDYGAYPADTAEQPTSNTLIWDDQAWGDGSLAVYPANSNVSMFSALDSVVDHFLNTDDFPNLVTMVIGGFSLGAQLVQRYSVFRNPVSAQEDKLKYWISSPASFVYFDDKRPSKFSKKKCPTWNEYKYGLDGILPTYYEANVSSSNSTKSSSKSISLSKAATKDLLDRNLARRVGYAVGLRDRISGDPRCEADAQGRVHVVKMENWCEEVLPELNGGAFPANSTIDYVKYIRHEDFRMIQSDPGVQRLFLDDYSSTSTSAAAPPSNGDVSGSPNNATDSNGVNSPVDPNSDESSSSASSTIGTGRIGLVGGLLMVGVASLI